VPHRAPGAVRGSGVCVERKGLQSCQMNAAARQKFRMVPLKGIGPCMKICENNPMHSR
jgi:hypothetical protein